MTGKTKAQTLKEIRFLSKLTTEQNIRFWQSNVRRDCIDGRITDQEIEAKIRQVGK